VTHDSSPPARTVTNQSCISSRRFIRLPSSLLGRVGLAVAACILALFVYGFFVWLTTETPTPASVRAKDPKALFDHLVKTAGPDQGQDAVDATQLITLDSNVESFRSAAVNAADTKTLTHLPEVAPGALQDLLSGPVSAKYPHIWPYIISGSFIVMGNALSDDPVVAFYNPWFDVVLLTKWSFKDIAGAKAGFRLMQAIPLSGRAFFENRASRSTDKPIWSDSTALFEVRIHDAANKFVAAFEQRYPPFGRNSETLTADSAAITTAISLTENRVFSLLQWVINAQNPNAQVNYVEGIKSLRDALSSSSPAKLAALLPKDNPQKAEVFFQLPAKIRSDMKPYLVIDRNVIFLDPRNSPTTFISAYFPADGAGYSLALAGLCKLEASHSAAQEPRPTHRR